MIYAPCTYTPHYPTTLRFPPVPLRSDTAAPLAKPLSTPRLTTPPTGFPTPRLMPSEPMPGLVAVGAEAAESREEKEPDFERRMDDAMMREVGVVGVEEGDSVGERFVDEVCWSVCCCWAVEGVAAPSVVGCRDGDMDGEGDCVTEAFRLTGDVRNGLSRRGESVPAGCSPAVLPSEFSLVLSSLLNLPSLTPSPAPSLPRLPLPPPLVGARRSSSE
jgi:hypothetical protein